jgi:mannose-6-phosphate isomerase-like protein (cupin superfamily)
MEVLVPKLVAATEKFDMVPCRDHKGAEPTPCRPDSDASLPEGGDKPYFLKADQGPRWAAGGLLVKPLATPAQTGGKFAIARVEGSAEVRGVLSERALTFAASHHAFFVDLGTFDFVIAGERKEVATGETVFVPAGVSFRFAVTSRYGAAFVFANGGGVVDFLVEAGVPYSSPVIAERFPTGLKEELALERGGCKIETENFINGSAAQVKA